MPSQSPLQGPVIVDEENASRQGLPRMYRTSARWMCSGQRGHGKAHMKVRRMLDCMPCETGLCPNRCGEGQIPYLLRYGARLKTYGHPYLQELAEKLDSADPSIRRVAGWSWGDSGEPKR